MRLEQFLAYLQILLQRKTSLIKCWSISIKLATNLSCEQFSMSAISVCAQLLWNLTLILHQKKLIFRTSFDVPWQNKALILCFLATLKTKNINQNKFEFNFLHIFLIKLLERTRIFLKNAQLSLFC